MDCTRSLLPSTFGCRTTGNHFAYTGFKTIHCYNVTSVNAYRSIAAYNSGTHTGKIHRSIAYTVSRQRVVASDYAFSSHAITAADFGIEEFRNHVSQRHTFYWNITPLSCPDRF
jgi:hypothetical protein